MFRDSQRSRAAVRSSSRSIVGARRADAIGGGRAHEIDDLGGGIVEGWGGGWGGRGGAAGGGRAYEINDLGLLPVDCPKDLLSPPRSPPRDPPCRLLVLLVSLVIGLVDVPR